MPGTLAALRGVAQPHSASDGTEPGTSGGQSVAHQWLRSVFSHARAAVITRKPGEGWHSVPAAWPLEQIASAVYDPARIVGIRPEGLIRLLLVDIDRKPDRVSPYWHPAGLSRQLQALEREAQAAGCTVTLIRSSASGGLHALITLPEPVKAWRAHWVALELITRAGMKEGPGVCELFPSQLAYSESTNPADWAQSHGFRLPGQDGSALLVGHRTASDTGLIYEQLLADLEDTEPGPAWDALLEVATQRCREARPRRGKIPRTASKRPHGVRWTGPGQSNQNLARITAWARAAHPHINTVEELAPIIRTAALQAPGFEQHASEATRRDLASSWAERWARCSLSRDRSHDAPRPTGGDKHHNSRLLQLSRAKLTRAWREAGATARQWGRRKVAEIAGLSRRIVDKHWAFWLQLLGGPHPSITGGGRSAVLSLRSFDLAVSVPPPASAESIAPAAPLSPEPEPPPDPPDCSARVVLPFRPDARPADEWRARQRAELAAWLAAAA